MASGKLGEYTADGLRIRTAKINRSIRLVHSTPEAAQRWAQDLELLGLQVAINGCEVRATGNHDVLDQVVSSFTSK